jgi:NAD(P)-dependent dehydrogenase (short-subunit alcohol dehydrogenase family)
MGWTADDIPDQTGRVALVTGASSGPGLAATRELTEARLRLGGPYDPWQAYNDSKRANDQFGIELARRLGAAGSAVASLVAHPGLAHTNLQVATVASGGVGASGRFWRLAARWFGLPPSRGVLGALRAATDPNARNGEFYGPRWEVTGPLVRLPVPDRSAPPAETERLWRISESATFTS